MGLTVSFFSRSLDGNSSSLNFVCFVWLCNFYKFQAFALLWLWWEGVEGCAHIYGLTIIRTMYAYLSLHIRLWMASIYRTS